MNCFKFIDNFKIYLIYVYKIFMHQMMHNILMKVFIIYYYNGNKMEILYLLNYSCISVQCFGEHDQNWVQQANMIDMDQNFN